MPGLGLVDVADHGGDGFEDVLPIPSQVRVRVRVSVRVRVRVRVRVQQTFILGPKRSWYTDTYVLRYMFISTN